MRIPVTAAYYKLVKAGEEFDLSFEQRLVPTAEPVPIITCLLGKRKERSMDTSDTEISTSVEVANFISGVFGHLKQYSGVQLQYRIDFNSTEKYTTSATIKRGSRPDTLVIVSNCTLLVGEDKCAHDIASAVKDLERKVTQLQKNHYGPVHFVLAYAAAGSTIQFFSIEDGAKVSLCGHVRFLR